MMICMRNDCYLKNDAVLITVPYVYVDIENFLNYLKNIFNESIF